MVAGANTWLEAWIDAERGRFTLWLPVAMGAGVLAYFSLRFEPPAWVGITAACLLISGTVAVRQLVWPRGGLMLLAAAACGVAAAQVATSRGLPLESLPTRATILTGTVRGVEILPDGRRIAVAGARLDEGAPLARWLRVRLKRGDDVDIRVGDTIRVRALLRPPAPPAFPGAWDLQRDAWFSGLGGSGYALGPVERLAVGTPGHILGMVQLLREIIARRITAAIPGAAGAVCVTLLTGTQTGIPPAEHDAFRASGLAHLLAVAGLHIGIVMGWVMAFARPALAASEYASLHWPTKQLAVLVALLGGAGYMVLTGMHVPIVRSFAMASLFTLAVLAGRRAISLRGLALAAVVLMLLAPQEVPGVSFQMSFSAVLALIAGYEALRPTLRRLHGDGSRLRRLALELTALALTSALAGTASAPFGAYHFGRIQLYFVVANMVAVPLAAFWVMPAGLIALLLMPLGLDSLALVPMGWGAEAILLVARLTASWPAATLDWPHMPPWGLAVTGFGMAWLGLWRSRLRLAGVAAIAFGLLSPLLVRPADILVSEDARLIGVLAHGQVFLQQRSGGSGFTRDAWLQYWAAGAPFLIPKDGVAADGAITCEDDVCRLRLRDAARAALLVRGTARPQTCRDISVIVSAEPARGLCARPWPALVDRFTVWRYGATAVWLDGRRATVLTDRAYRGERPWVPSEPTPKDRPSPSLPPAGAETAAVVE